jgi:ATP-dependent DNA ligase
MEGAIKVLAWNSTSNGRAVDSTSPNPPTLMEENTRYQRQKYLDIHISEVDQVTHPICQLKFDGIWCRCDVDEAHTARYYSRNGEHKKTEKLAPSVPAGSYIGELMFGSEWSKEENRSGKFFIFELIEDRYGDHRSLPYIDRYVRAQRIYLASAFPRHWELVSNYPTADSLTIWNLLVATERYEGLVFRHPANNWHQPLLRSKYELTEDLYICGFVEGEGRLKGNLGALEATYSPIGVGPKLLIGGGLTDKMRRTIWKNQHEFVGRCFTVTAKKKFKSGLLRHPNFKEWHADK